MMQFPGKERLMEYRSNVSNTRICVDSDRLYLLVLQFQYPGISISSPQHLFEHHFDNGECNKNGSYVITLDQVTGITSRCPSH